MNVFNFVKHETIGEVEGKKKSSYNLLFTFKIR
jgi:hypothetical protein